MLPGRDRDGEPVSGDGRRARERGGPDSRHAEPPRDVTLSQGAEAQVVFTSREHLRPRVQADGSEVGKNWPSEPAHFHNGRPIRGGDRTEQED